MKFGKLENIEKVNFQLPPEPAGNRVVLEKPEPDAPVFYIGCTGWSMKEWLGKIYPTGTKTADFLKIYTRQFNTIELNTTHYRIPDPATILKWKAESAGDFKFCPKLPQIISHSGDLGVGSENLSKFCASVQLLEEKLGCCFLQLPPYFGPDRLPVLARFLKNFPNHIPLAVELRHEDWFEKAENTDAVFSLFESLRIAPVITDVAGRRDVLHMRLSSDKVLIRFVGNNLHPTDFQRLDQWAERLENWVKQGLNEVYFFCHEPDNLLAPDLSVYLLSEIQKRNFAQTRGPKFIESGGEQMRLF